MTPHSLTMYREQLTKDFSFHAEVFNKPIWGDMGEDSAQVTITLKEQAWHIAFIRTQTGEPSPFDEFVCNIIDKYEKELTDEALYDMLALHALLSDFEFACTSFFSQKSV